MQTAAFKPEFISNYQGVSDYRVAGLPGRVSWRGLNKEHHAFYRSPDDPQLLGTVINGTKPVSPEVLAIFQRKQDELFDLMPDADLFYLDSLTTAKWYPHLGWIRCEPTATPLAAS
jgi:hypothetical protein